MKALSNLSAVLSVIALFAGAASAQTAPKTPEAELMAVDAAFAHDSQSEHEKAWGKYAADDAVTSAGVGRPAILAAYAKLYATPGLVFVWTPDGAMISGDLGVTRGHYRLARPGKPASTGVYLTVWRRTAGTWRYVWDDGTEDPAAKP